MLLGVVAGALLLTSATVLPALAFWAAYAGWKFRSDVFRGGRWAAPLIVIAMLAPWTARNYFVFHRFIPLRSALGLALEASENDCAPVGVTQSEDSGCFGQHSPNHNIAEAELARSLGEPEYNALKLRTTMHWIASHPGHFARLTAERTYAFWFPHEGNSLREEFGKASSRRKERLAIYVTTILSIPGLVLLAKAKREAAIILGSWLVFFPPIYYIALYEDRYRYPILWVTFICAGYFLRRIAGVLFPSHGAAKETRAL